MGHKVSEISLNGHSYHFFAIKNNFLFFFCAYKVLKIIKMSCNTLTLQQRDTFKTPIFVFVILQSIKIAVLQNVKII